MEGETGSLPIFSLGHLGFCKLNRKNQISLLYSMFGKIPVEVGHLWGLIFGGQLESVLDFSLETPMNNRKDVPKPESFRCLAPFGIKPWLGKLWPVGSHYSNYDSLSYTQQTQTYRVEGDR